MATRFSLSRLRAADANSRVMPGAKLAFYQSGTSTPKPIYSDAGLTTAHLNPVIADAGGRFPDIYLENGLYKASLLDAADAVQWTSDPIGKEVLDETQITIATQAQAEAGTNNTALMTPLRVTQAMDQRFSALEWEGNRGRIQGLALANNATDTEHDIDISAGLAATEASPFRLMSLTATLTKRVDAAWAVGSGQGGLDTGTVAADTWYHLHLIRRSDTGVVDALFSTSATAPTMPTSYAQRRRIGAVRTDASANILAFFHRADWFLWTTPTRDFNASIGTTRTLVTLRSPTGLALLAKVRAYQAGGQVSSLTPVEETDVAPSSSAAPLNNVWSNVQASELDLWTNTSAQVAARSVGTTTLQVVTVGWRDERGRND